MPATFAVTRERRDGTIALVIGDVGSGILSGPLMAAAMAAAAGRIADEGVTAGNLLNALSRIVRCPDPSVAVSATAAVLFPQASRVEVSTAGYCPPILLRAEAAAPLTMQVEPPLFSTGEWTYSGGATFTLEPDERVLFYTNAAIEVTGTGDSLLGVDGLAPLAAEHRHDDADALLASLDAALGRHTEGRSAGVYSRLHQGHEPLRACMGSSVRGDSLRQRDETLEALRQSHAELLLDAEELTR